MKHKKRLTTLFLIFISLISLNAQQISGHIQDIHEAPIPYATIQIGDRNGVLSNGEGDFSILIPTHLKDSIMKISFMGYETFEVAVSEIENNHTYTLIEQVTELGEVLVSNKQLTPLEIVNKMIEMAPSNYVTENINQTFFIRNTNKSKLEDLELELNKLTDLDRKERKKLNEEIEDFTKSYKNSNFEFFDEYYGKFFTYKDSSKIQIKKAVLLKNNDKDINSEKLTTKVVDLLTKYLDTTATYKVKSGMFKMEDSITTKEFLVTENEKDSTSSTNFLRNQLSYKYKSLNMFYENEDVDFFDKQNRYEYTLEGYTTINNEMAYIIRFVPRKGSALYYGKMYINVMDYALVRLDCQMLESENLHNLNLKFLVGVHVKQDRIGISWVFEKNSKGKYNLKFAKKEEGVYAYISRPIKFKKNKTNRSDDKSVFKINFTFETNSFSITEFYALENAIIDEAEFSKIENQDSYKCIELKKYDPNVWEGYNIIAPIESIKNYGLND
ncbi:hypothetical protein NBRC110019_09030 [Neptunitalea chrysea]|uniref:CarboxypepD_reg-like domain-containing protein n=1 Tax=Neptunitalea chrysea TaxID=1647581 RepID=A0A9W6B3L1_9FLAO|nr:carboxypeptidase-like regulatory domain-containing protein [Neptunitalea chrysea]GLB51864.1 hypothetical protein NBRC110019_09030 [Neptunitalea chrysea]